MIKIDWYHYGIWYGAQQDGLYPGPKISCYAPVATYHSTTLEFTELLSTEFVYLQTFILDD